MVAQAAMKSTIFADSILDVSWAQRSRRSLTTLTSFGLQAVVLSLLLLISLLKTIMLPEVRTVSTPLSLGRREVQPLVGWPHASGAAAPTNPHAIQFVQPGSIPTTFTRGDELLSAGADRSYGLCRLHRHVRRHQRCAQPFQRWRSRGHSGAAAARTRARTSFPHIVHPARHADPSGAAGVSPDCEDSARTRRGSDRGRDQQSRHYV